MLNGARVGDLFMSLIHTCELNHANPFDYLTKVQKHSGGLIAKPARVLGRGEPGQSDAPPCAAQILSWYPFQAKCLTAKVVSPRRKGEAVEVIMAPDDVCVHGMLVLVRWLDSRPAHGRGRLTGTPTATVRPATPPSFRSGPPARLLKRGALPCQFV